MQMTKHSTLWQIYINTDPDKYLLNDVENCLGNELNAVYPTRLKITAFHSLIHRILNTPLL